jgi:hypothetical protein
MTVEAPMYIIAIVLLAGFLIAAFFYVRWARHSRARPLAAYFIFVIAFTVSSFALFAALIVLLNELGRMALLSDPIAAAVFLLVVFVPAFLVARWQLRKPPSLPGPL